ncbi:MAG: hypothetical protein WBW93_18220 [Steroidobacteraceae bacterium]
MAPARAKCWPSITVKPKTASPVADLYATAEKAKRWFLGRACSRSHGDWDRRGGLSDSRHGAVYVFFDRNGNALYVGQTGASLKERANYETSRHYDTVWWNKWTTLRFLNIGGETDRLALELLLILSLAPNHNVTPCFRPLAEMQEGLTMACK